MSAADVPSGGSVAAKVDPETLAIRTAPMRVTRFRRGAIIGIAAASSVAIAGAAWLALKPASLGLLAAADDVKADAKAPPEIFTGAPARYDDVQSSVRRFRAISAGRSCANGGVLRSMESPTNGSRRPTGVRRRMPKRSASAAPRLSLQRANPP